MTAVLLCGGKGERMRPLTNETPKTLVPLAGKPVLDHLLRYLAAEGVSRFVICAGYKAEAIKTFLRERADPSWQCNFVDSGDASMTDRVLDARRHVDGRALICYGDTLANVSLSELSESHRKAGGLATITTYPLHSPFGIVHFDEQQRVSAFVEKPTLPYWINIGFILCEPEALDYMRRGSDMVEFLSLLAQEGALGVHRHTGKHLTVNTEKERADAELALIEFFTYLDGQQI